MEKFDPHQSLTLEALEKYGTDLTKMAKENKLDPVIGRQQQIERVTQILCKRRKNNPCLIGDPGVGKSVIVEGLAQLIATASVPLKLRDKKIFSIEMGRLIAGASNRGDFEERLIKIADEVKQSKGVVVLFIDEVHTLIGAGAGNQALDASNIFKPALARGELKCIGATTQEEYKKYIEKDPALQRRFQLVEVTEPSVDETVQILKGLSTKYESHHTVRFTDKALIAAARLSKQYIGDRFLPDKAIDLIDEAGARAGLHQPWGSDGSPVLITEIDIEKVVSLMIGTEVYSEESKRFIHMEAKLQQSIVGQDGAVKAVSLAIRRALAGVRDSNRPISCFLFTGPTGVGKTELAKVLATEYFGCKEAIVRLDMSEYMEKHSVAKLLGSPPGYIGHEDGGHLTEAVRRRPHCVVLFDEIEKAHGDMFNTMLQILEDGRMRDKGRTVDFRNAIIIMTSNIGGELSGEADKVSKEVTEQLKKNFRPEFLNRLDDVIVFEKIGYTEMKEILEIMLKNLYERFEAKNVKLEVTLELKNKLVLEGYNPLYGARPLRRTITRLLEDTLAEKMLSGYVKEGDSITMDVDSDGDVTVCC